MKTLARPDDRLELLRRLHTLRPTTPRRWGRMSVHEMVCHVADAYRMATGEKVVVIRTNLLTSTLVKWTALYLPLPWPPGIIPTSPEVDPKRGGTPPGAFDADVASLAALVERFSAWPRLAGRPHPLFGALSEAEWLRWGYLHMDHHLRQFGARSG